MKWSLAEFGSRWRIPAVLALTVESSRLAVDHLRRENGSSNLLRSLSLPIGSDALLEHPEKAGRELAALLDGAGIRERRCVVCLPPAWVLIATSDVPDVAAEDLRSYFELQAEREFPLPPADLRLAHSRYLMPDGTRKATLAALPNRRLEAVRLMLETAGCRPLSISLALDPGMVESAQPDAGSLNILVNGNHVDLVVAAGGGVVSLRSVRTPGLSAEGGVPLNQDSLGRELRITLGQLPAPIRGRVRTAKILGIRSSAEALLEAAQGQLQHLGLQGMVPARPGLSRIAATSGAELPGVAVGAADRHLHGRPMLFEFVAPETSGWQTFLRRFDTRRNRWLTALGLTCVVLPAVLMIARARTESRLQSEWSRMQPIAEELEGIQAKLRLFRPWFDASSPSVDMLTGLVGAFPESGELWAKSVEIREDGRIVCSGFARSQGNWMDFLDRLGQQPGIAELQVQSVRGENPLQFTLSFAWRPSHDE